MMDIFFYHAQRASHPSHYSIHTTQQIYSVHLHMLSQDSTLHISLLAQTKSWGLTEFSLTESLSIITEYLRAMPVHRYPRKYISKAFQ